MPTLTPLLVKIELTSEAKASYPSFDTLASVISSGQDWSSYVDTEGQGWAYDKSSGHDDDTPSGRGLYDSPRGQQYGVLLIPLLFANEAVAAFPSECSILTETDVEDFWDNFHAVEQPENLEDETILQIMADRKTITGKVKPSDLAVLDPDDPKPGVKRNPRKTWQRYKADRNITVG